MIEIQDISSIEFRILILLIIVWLCDNNNNIREHIHDLTVISSLLFCLTLLCNNRNVLGLVYC